MMDPVPSAFNYDHRWVAAIIICLARIVVMCCVNNSHIKDKQHVRCETCRSSSASLLVGDISDDLVWCLVVFAYAMTGLFMMEYYVHYAVGWVLWVECVSIAYLVIAVAVSKETNRYLRCVYHSGHVVFFICHLLVSLVDGNPKSTSFAWVMTVFHISVQFSVITNKRVACICTKSYIQALENATILLLLYRSFVPSMSVDLWRIVIVCIALLCLISREAFVFMKRTLTRSHSA